MGKKTLVDVIADNGGGITLQYHGRKKFLHYYDHPHQVIEDLIAIADGDNVSSWDGNEYDPIPGPGEYVRIFEKYSYETERNGGYKWFSGTAKDILQTLLESDPEDFGWYNIRGMIKAIKM